MSKSKIKSATNFSKYSSFIELALTIFLRGISEVVVGGWGGFCGSGAGWDADWGVVELTAIAVSGSFCPAVVLVVGLAEFALVSNIAQL